MVITKELKYARFTWDDDKKEFFLEKLDGDFVTDKFSLNKIYAFALLRFIIRIGQRNWFRKFRKGVNR